MLQFFSYASCYKDCSLCALGSSEKAFPMLNYSVRAFLRMVLLFWRIKGWETELDVSVPTATAAIQTMSRHCLLRTFWNPGLSVRIEASFPSPSPLNTALVVGTEIFFEVLDRDRKFFILASVPQLWSYNLLQLMERNQDSPASHSTFCSSARKHLVLLLGLKQSLWQGPNNMEINSFFLFSHKVQAGSSLLQNLRLRIWRGFCTEFDEVREHNKSWHLWWQQEELYRGE